MWTRICEVVSLHQSKRGTEVFDVSEAPLHALFDSDTLLFVSGEQALETGASPKRSLNRILYVSRSQKQKLIGNIHLRPLTSHFLGIAYLMRKKHVPKTAISK